MFVVASPVASPVQAQPEGGQGTSLGFQPVADSEAMAMAIAALRAATERVHRLAMQQEPQESELSEELLVYRPQGERDAVVVTDKDMEGLQPTKFISNNIVDFYVRYLEFKLPIEVRNCVYFFNSFFFRKLESSTTSTRITQCKVNYGQVKEWSKGINLFEKDYVFIPILKSSHWSLVIICHLKSLTRSPDEMTRSPCILHLDPIEGQHESFEGVIRSYLLEAWMERFDPSKTVDQFLSLCQMKYVQAKVPLQKNSYDCGSYVLNYIEAFLSEPSSPYSSVAVSESGPHFSSYDFQRWTLEKRSHIQNLILERSRVYQERVRKRRTIMNLTDELSQISRKLWTCLEDQGPSGGCVQDVQTGGPSVIWNGEESEMKPASTHEDAMDVPRPHPAWIPPFGFEAVQVPEIEHAEYRERNEGFSDKLQHPEPDETPHVVSSSAPPQGSNKRGRVWNEEETVVLLECKAKGGRFCKGGRGGADWKLICTEIGMKSGNMPTEEQCRRRYDTLKKAFETCKKYCLKNGKAFGEITEEERVELRLATKLSEEWYATIDEICEKAKSPKRIKVNSNRGLGLHPLGLLDAPAPNALAISTGRALDDGAAVVESGRKIGGDMPHDDFQGFSTLNEDLLLTLVHVVQELQDTILFNYKQKKIAKNMKNPA